MGGLFFNYYNMKTSPTSYLTGDYEKYTYWYRTLETGQVPVNYFDDYDYKGSINGILEILQAPSSKRLVL